MKIRNEGLILLSILTACLLAIGLLFEWQSLVKETYEIQLYDTYFVGSIYILLLYCFIFVTFLVYLLRQIKGKFKIVEQNVILITVVGALVLGLHIFSVNLQVFALQSIKWTIIAPTTSLEEDVPLFSPATDFVRATNTGIYTVQFFLLLGLITLCFVTGRLSKESSKI